MDKLSADLSKHDMNLQDFGSNNPNANESLEEMLKIILIVVTTILGILCIVLLITYCVQTKRQVFKISTNTMQGFLTCFFKLVKNNYETYLKSYIAKNIGDS